MAADKNRLMTAALGRVRSGSTNLHSRPVLALIADDEMAGEGHDGDFARQPKAAIGLAGLTENEHDHARFVKNLDANIHLRWKPNIAKLRTCLIKSGLIFS